MAENIMKIRLTAVQKMLLFFIGCVVLLLLGGLFFQMILAPKMKIKTVHLESDLALSSREILSLAGIDSETSYFSLNTATVESRLERHPQVGGVSVKRIFPDQVKILLSKRRPLGICLIDTGSFVEPAAFDSAGVFFQDHNELEDWNFPILTGFQLDRYEAGLQLPSAYLPLLEALERIREEDHMLFLLISEIEIINKNNENYECSLYLTSSSIKTRIGKTLSRDEIKKIIMVQDVLNRQGLTDQVEELDIRSGRVIYRKKEA